MTAPEKFNVGVSVGDCLQLRQYCGLSYSTYKGQRFGYCMFNSQYSECSHELYIVTKVVLSKHDHFVEVVSGHTGLCFKIFGIGSRSHHFMKHEELCRSNLNITSEIDFTQCFDVISRFEPCGE